LTVIGIYGTMTLVKFVELSNIYGGYNMKSTGIVRKVDELGRVVLPIELRRTLDIAEKDALEIYVDGATIILKKYEPACIFCGDAKDVNVYKGKNICPNCMKELKK
jgi:AbrB family transcriptional regulator, transcriptional pleiotropic regulator of transition state genes